MIQSITILKAGLPIVREIIKPFVGKDIESIVQILPLEDEKAENKAEDGKLYLKNENYTVVVKEIATQLGEKKEDLCTREQAEYFPDLRDSKEKILNLVKDAGNILGRAYGRRTGMVSWILLGALNKIGFRGDSFEPVKEILNNQAFLEKFAKYWELKDDKAKTDECLKDFNSPQEAGLAKLLSFNINIFSKLPDKAVATLPVIYAIQNLLVPLAARIVKKGFFGKLFDLIRMINPWIGEFIAEPIGIFKTEIQNLQKNRTATTSGIPRKAEVNSIDLSNLDLNEYGLQKIVRKVNSAFGRLFGRMTNVSSLALNLALKAFGEGKKYEEFAKGFVENPKFISDFHSKLKHANEQVKDETKDEEKKKSTLLQNLKNLKHISREQIVEWIVSKSVSISQSISQGFIDKSTKYFGLPYSFQYLFMPIITKVVKEDTFFGKLLGLIRDVNPLLNDLFFEPVSTFQEEINEIKSVLKDNSSIGKLFKPLTEQLDVKGRFDFVVDSISDIVKTIRNFGKGLTTKDGAPT